MLEWYFNGWERCRRSNHGTGYIILHLHGLNRFEYLVLSCMCYKYMLFMLYIIMLFMIYCYDKIENTVIMVCGSGYDTRSSVV